MKCGNNVCWRQLNVMAAGSQGQNTGLCLNLERLDECESSLPLVS